MKKLSQKHFHIVKIFNKLNLVLIQNFERIEYFLFEQTSIQKVTIPSSVKIICSDAFRNCNKLKEIEIPNDSELRKIEFLVFNFSNVESITIPSKFVEFEESWCKDVYYLNRVWIKKGKR